jgi:hypothetical protein
MLAARAPISTGTEPVDGTEGAGVDLPMEVATVPAVVVQRIFAGVVPDWQTGYWWQAAEAVKAAVTIPVAAEAEAADITEAAEVVQGYRHVVATVQETVTMDRRAREAPAVMQVMDVLPGTIIMVAMVEKGEVPPEVMEEDIAALVILEVEELKTEEVPEVQRPVSVMQTRSPVAVAVVEAAMPKPAAQM